MAQSATFSLTSPIPTQSEMDNTGKYRNTQAAQERIFNNTATLTKKPPCIYGSVQNICSMKRSETVDKGHKTVDNLASMWINPLFFTNSPGVSPEGYPHIWGVL